MSSTRINDFTSNCVCFVFYTKIPLPRFDRRVQCMIKDAKGTVRVILWSTHGFASWIIDAALFGVGRIECNFRAVPPAARAHKVLVCASAEVKRVGSREECNQKVIVADTNWSVKAEKTPGANGISTECARAALACWNMKNEGRCLWIGASVDDAQTRIRSQFAQYKLKRSSISWWLSQSTWNTGASFFIFTCANAFEWAL